MYVSSIGVTGRHAPEALHTIFTWSAVWFPVAHRIYTFLPIEMLRQLFQYVGSVSCCCFVFLMRKGLPVSCQLKWPRTNKALPSLPETFQAGFCVQCFWSVMMEVFFVFFFFFYQSICQSINIFTATCQFVTVMLCSPSRRMQWPPQIPVRQREMRGYRLPL